MGLCKKAPFVKKVIKQILQFISANVDAYLPKIILWVDAIKTDVTVFKSGVTNTRHLNQYSQMLQPEDAARLKDAFFVSAEKLNLLSGTTDVLTPADFVVHKLYEIKKVNVPLYHATLFKLAAGMLAFVDGYKADLHIYDTLAQTHYSSKKLNPDVSDK